MIDSKEKNVKTAEMMADCNAWFDKLAELLKDEFVVVPSDNPKSSSRCLVPKGTEFQLTYYGKPYNSFRVAKNWNWRANLDKCVTPNYVQCYSLDMPWPKRRSEENPKQGTSPMLGCAVMYFGADRQYHVVYGEKFDRDTRTWSYVQNNLDDIAKIARDGIQIAKAMENKDNFYSSVAIVNAPEEVKE